MNKHFLIFSLLFLATRCLAEEINYIKMLPDESLIKQLYVEQEKNTTNPALLKSINCINLGIHTMLNPAAVARIVDAPSTINPTPTYDNQTNKLTLNSTEKLSHKTHDLKQLQDTYKKRQQERQERLGHMWMQHVTMPTRLAIFLHVHDKSENIFADSNTVQKLWLLAEKEAEFVSQIFMQTKNDTIKNPSA